MEVHCDEGVAIRIGPEPCAWSREGPGEASVGEQAGWVLSRERRVLGVDPVSPRGRPHGQPRYCEWQVGPARSETPSMHGRSLSGNREISGLTMADMSDGPHREGRRGRRR